MSVFADLARAPDLALAAEIAAAAGTRGVGVTDLAAGIATTGDAEIRALREMGAPVVALRNVAEVAAQRKSRGRYSNNSRNWHLQNFPDSILYQCFLNDTIP